MNDLTMVSRATDPVCGMDVNREIASAEGLTSQHDEMTYFFCGKGCKLDFDDDPAKFFDPSYQPRM